MTNSKLLEVGEARDIRFQIDYNFFVGDREIVI